MKRSYLSLLGLFTICGLRTLSADAPLIVAETADSSESNETMAMMDGFCHFQGFHLNDPLTGKPLTGRYVEIIIVNGEIDPPFVEGDDRVQESNEFYNSGSHKNWLNNNPGLVEAMVTVRVEKIDPADDRCQLWESVILRAYNNDDKFAATHYIDSELWECPPGYVSVTPDQIVMGEWQPVTQD